MKHEKTTFTCFSQKYQWFIDVFKGVLLLWKNKENKYVVLTVTITFSCVFGALINKMRKNTNTLDLQ